MSPSGCAVPATVDLAGSAPRVARVVEDVDDSVREAAAPARVVVAAAELPVGYVVSCLDQCVVEGAGVLKQGALFRPGFEEQAAGAGVRSGRRSRRLPRTAARCHRATTAPLIP